MVGIQSTTQHNTGSCKANKDSWKRPYKELATLPREIRLQRTLAESPINAVGTLYEPNKSQTRTGKEIMDSLTKVHFPGSEIKRNDGIQLGEPVLYNRAN